MTSRIAPRSAREVLIGNRAPIGISAATPEIEANERSDDTYDCRQKCRSTHQWATMSGAKVTAIASIELSSSRSRCPPLLSIADRVRASGRWKAIEMLPEREKSVDNFHYREEPNQRDWRMSGNRGQTKSSKSKTVRHTNRAAMSVMRLSSFLYCQRKF